MTKFTHDPPEYRDVVQPIDGGPYMIVMTYIVEDDLVQCIRVCKDAMKIPFADIIYLPSEEVKVILRRSVNV